MLTVGVDRAAQRTGQPEQLRGADLTRADLLGADLRGADLRGADLGSSVFLTRPQVHAARGDSTTLVPSWCDRPPHWRRAPRMPAR